MCFVYSTKKFKLQANQQPSGSVNTVPNGASEFNNEFCTQAEERLCATQEVSDSSQLEMYDLPASLDQQESSVSPTSLGQQEPSALATSVAQEESSSLPSSLGQQETSAPTSVVLFLKQLHTASQLSFYFSVVVV